MAWDRSLESTVRRASETGPTLTPVAARQGVISGRVLLVLTVSLTLIVAAFALIYVMPL